MKASIRFTALFLAFAAGSALGQAYPAKPVRMLVPFPPGGGVDVVARTFSQKLSEAWGQQVIVENRPGAGGNIAADLVAKAPPDGYTLLITTTGHAVAPSLFRKLPFDPIKDFAAASQITSTYLILVANPGMPATLKELVALAKSQPGKLNYGHTGLGVAPHLVGEMLKSAAGINIVMVTYKGDAQTIPAMLANEVQLGFSPPTSVVGHVKAGRLRALAVSGAARGSAFPDVPTVTEAGYPDATYNGWVGFFAPGGTPREILTRVSSETARALRMPDVAARLPSWGAEAAGTSPDEFAARYRADIVRYAKVIKEANVPLVD
jgi:tripartite-type tricarboxylate transporter receptor subunit TctC